MVEVQSQNTISEASEAVNGFSLGRLSLDLAEVNDD